MVFPPTLEDFPHYISIAGLYKYTPLISIKNPYIKVTPLRTRCLLQLLSSQFLIFSSIPDPLVEDCLDFLYVQQARVAFLTITYLISCYLIYLVGYSVKSTRLQLYFFTCAYY